MKNPKNPHKKHQKKLTIITTTIFLIISITQQITPLTENPIYTTISNSKEFSDYIFTFKLEKDLPAGGYIIIKFPKQFQENLGIFLWGVCNHTCSIINYDVFLKIDEGIKKNEKKEIILNKIKNPLKIGGTGQFVILSQFYDDVIEENKNFGSIGIGSNFFDIFSIDINIDKNFENKSNGVQNYLIRFKIVEKIKTNFFFKIEFEKNIFKFPDNKIIRFFDNKEMEIFLTYNFIYDRLETNIIFFELEIKKKYFLEIELINPNFEMVF